MAIDIIVYPENGGTLLQPFFGYTDKGKTTFALNSESSRDWYGNQWIVPLNFQIQQPLKIGKQPIAFQAGYRYYVVRPSGDSNWGLRFTVTLLFPHRPP